MRTLSPKFCTFPSNATRGLHPTPPSNPGVGTPALPKAVTYPEGLVETQPPAVSDAHPVVSARSQLSTCEDARPYGGAPPPGDMGSFGDQSINLLASCTPVPSRYKGQGRDSKPSESGVKTHGKKSLGRSFLTAVNGVEYLSVQLFSVNVACLCG